ERAESAEGAEGTEEAEEAETTEGAEATEAHPYRITSRVGIFRDTMFPHSRIEMTMKRILIIPVLMALLITACDTQQTANNADAQFERVAKSFIEEYLAMHPEMATYLGDHRNDTELDDVSMEGIQAAIDLRNRYLDSLNAMKVEDLNNTNRVDYGILRSSLEYDVFTYTELQPQVTNPMMYNVGGAIYSLLAREFAPLEERMKSVEGRLRALPAVFEAARQNLNNPPKIHTETAIQQNQGNITLLEVTLQEFIDKLPEDQRDDIMDLRDETVQHIKDYGEWLENDLLPRSNGEFRLGTTLYDQKLSFVVDNYMTRPEILERAEQLLIETTSEMYSTALPLYRELPQAQRALDESDTAGVIRAVLANLANDHPTNDNIVDFAKETLVETEEFVKANDLVTVPTEPVEIIVMPEFQRGVAVAYCDSPGALEEGGKTFYAISPTPEDWSKDRRQSFYREYNNYMLKNLTVHEAMPGHYLQLVSGNKAESPTMIRHLFQSGLFAEGWATYTEQMMVEHGFGGPQVKMQQLKMFLRLLINSIIDQKIHAAGMTEDEAMALMMERGFQEEGEAAGKWRRACLTSCQLSTYFVGNTMMNDIRDRYEAMKGDAFNLKAYHDEVISYGTISPNYLTTILKLPARDRDPEPAAASVAGE
ncbi:MAG: hypothetical protein CL946_07910, partial [Ectothiorhodospiraceae bacterium]|nr:hypothetical protein [Ectothiorhodospiraceae bacterium]